jgi:hypothetical protein
MANRVAVHSVIEYGIQAMNSKTILAVTEDPVEAERTLDILGEGRLVQRTVSYSPWASVPD